MLGINKNEPIVESVHLPKQRSTTPLHKRCAKAMTVRTMRNEQSDGNTPAYITLQNTTN